MLNYGAFPIDKWSWVDFGVGTVIGAYFPIRDHLYDDCYSGLFHTASLLIDTNRNFNWVPNGSTSDIIFAWNLDPFFAAATML